MCLTVRSITERRPARAGLLLGVCYGFDLPLGPGAHIGLR